jgi:pyoverdine/dityrosine biosynthesis protein Dit1
MDPLISEITRQTHMRKIEEFVAWSKPVHMILPAFPAKSPNPRKTVSHRPDYGEVLALSNLNDLCKKIRNIYAPGAIITICSDGRVFSDLVQVHDDAVGVYGKEIQDIISDRKMSNLSVYSLDDVYGRQTFSFMRNRLVNEFAEEINRIRERIKIDADLKNLFNGIHRFMYEDQIALQIGKSKNWVRGHSKGLAYQVIQRSNAWSRLVERRFPEALRLSIHPQSIWSPKIGIRLLPSDDIWRTPWHSVLVSRGGNFYLAPREQAEANGGILTYAENKYAYYEVTA